MKREQQNSQKEAATVRIITSFQNDARCDANRSTDREWHIVGSLPRSVSPTQE
jgi:hypothetical protein